MLDLECVDLCKNKKNLLAFSAGVDSTALFFLLIDQNIDFDIAIVDYNQRDQSKLEITYAKELAKKYNKNIFIKEYKQNSFSEKKARDFRYDFFDDMVQTKGYETVLMAHQLNDQFEWLLMQFSKGAGLIELLGLHKIEQKQSYSLIRPLLDISKDELISYLEQNKIKYFVDHTNKDTKFTRNKIREKYSNEFIKEYSIGVQKSFEYLHEDYNSLIKSGKLIFNQKDLYIFSYNDDENVALRVIDIQLKKMGILISSKTRAEIIKNKEVVVSHKIAIALKNNLIFIAPIYNKTIPKEFKEIYRKNGIPKNIRAYIYSENIDINNLI